MSNTLLPMIEAISGLDILSTHSVMPANSYRSLIPVTPKSGHEANGFWDRNLEVSIPEIITFMLMVHRERLSKSRPHSSLLTEYKDHSHHVINVS